MTRDQLDGLVPGELVRERQAGSTVKEVVKVGPGENGFVWTTNGLRKTRVRKATLLRRFEIVRII